MNDKLTINRITDRSISTMVRQPNKHANFYSINNGESTYTKLNNNS